MSASSEIRSKRDRQTEIHLSPSPKKARGTKNPSLQNFRLIGLSNSFGEDPNVVRLHSRDIKVLSTKCSKRGDPSYLMIADRIFQVVSDNSTPSGAICVPKLHYDDIKARGFQQDGDTRIIASIPMPPSSAIPPDIMTACIYTSDAAFSTNTTANSLSRKELNEAFNTTFSGKLIVIGQKYGVTLASGLRLGAHFKLPSSAPDTHSGDSAEKVSRFVWINSSTLFDYDPCGEKPIVIRKKIKAEPQELTLQFSACGVHSKQAFHLQEDPGGDVCATFAKTEWESVDTIVFSKNELLKRMKNAVLVDKMLYPGFSTEIWIDNTRSIKVTCKTIQATNTTEYTKPQLSKNVLPVVDFHPDMRLEITPDKTLLLGNDVVETAETIEFNLKVAIKAEIIPKEYFSLPRLIVSEFNAIVRKLNTNFAAGQHLELKLSTGKFRLQVLSADSSHNNESGSSSDTSLNRIFNISEHTRITLFSQIPKGALLVQDTKSHPLKTLTVKVSMLHERPEIKVIQQSGLETFVRRLGTLPILKNQTFKYKPEGVKLLLLVKQFSFAELMDDSAHHRFGQITPSTEIKFTTNIEHSFQINNTSALGVPDIHSFLKDLKLGGIGQQAQLIRREILIPLGSTSPFLKELNLNAPRGMLLYGPSGTGKTSLAKELARILDCRKDNGRLKMATASEVFGPLMGDSERGVRELFAAAREDTLNHDEGKAPLHVIILDELEAAFSSREGGVARVNNSVVAQLLGELDGVDSPQNILFIGITNHKDLIDPALLRSGRLGVHIEFKLPNVSEREEIFGIHTAKLKEKNMLAEDVNLRELAERSAPLTGADIKAICDQAVIDVIDRSEGPSSSSSSTSGGLKVTMADFLRALESKNPFKPEGEKLNYFM